jgi:hypothetical protein
MLAQPFRFRLRQKLRNYGDWHRNSAIKMVFAVNGMAVLDVYAIGVLEIFLFEKVRPKTPGS